MLGENYDHLYIEGVRHFNAHDFFEAHEVWEEIWAKTMGRDQLFYKGLIHAAVALHHLGNHNLRGARKVWGSCRQYLDPYSPKHLGLDVAQFLDRLRECFAGIDQVGDVPTPSSLTAAQIPRIELDPPPSCDETQP